MPIPVPGRLADALRQSTVQILSGDRLHNGHGSGVIIGPAQVVTNAHVVRSEHLTIESWEGKRCNASVVRSDRRRDLALLSVPDLNGASVTLGDSSLLRAGTPVVAIGNPFGFVGALSSGVVHSVGRVHVRGPNGGTAEWVCADVHLAPGNSGGPLADFHGHVVGINTMIAAGGLAFAVPSRAVQRFVAHAGSPAKLGVVVRQVTLRSGRPAMLILELVEQGAAQAASLLAGDVLIAADGKSLAEPEDLLVAMEECAGGLLHLDFYRGSQDTLRHVTARLQPERTRDAA
ncbi:MAG: trypsin-like peptidase domain-containing protein [Acidobacteriaceae bacterium]|nr:trypsin-like peptidase domain-containing protein [Acidobacteriaceae bacterium]MBV8570448.1 trypsin-like peptidase domain-containing protein [Acidobacteriaceae bacterium]